MADTLLLVDAARVVDYTPPRKPTSATLVFRSPAGDSLSTPTVTVDSLARTVTAVDSTTPETKFTAATGSGTPVVGRYYWWTSGDDGAHGALVRLAEIDANVWTLAGPVPGSTKVQVGDTLAGVRLTATVPSSVTTAKGANYRLEWTITYPDSVVDVHQQIAHVCRTLYRDAVEPREAMDHLSRVAPNHGRGRPWGYFVDLAERASERVWLRVRHGDRLINLFGSSLAFRQAGLVALDIELLSEHVVPPSILDVDAHREALEKRLDREIEDAISGQTYDLDDDGIDDVADTQRAHSIPLRRS